MCSCLEMNRTPALKPSVVSWFQIISYLVQPITAKAGCLVETHCAFGKQFNWVWKTSCRPGSVSQQSQNLYKPFTYAGQVESSPAVLNSNSNHIRSLTLQHRPLQVHRTHVKKLELADTHHGVGTKMNDTGSAKHKGTFPHPQQYGMNGSDVQAKSPG